MSRKALINVGACVVLCACVVMLGTAGRAAVRLGIPDHEMSSQAGVVGGACGGCASEACTTDPENPKYGYFNYGCRRVGSQWMKKVGTGNTVATCDQNKTGGCNFGEEETVCFTVYICGSDNTCADCIEDPYYNPTECTADE